MVNIAALKRSKLVSLPCPLCILHCSTSFSRAAMQIAECMQQLCSLAGPSHSEYTLVSWKRLVHLSNASVEHQSVRTASARHNLTPSTTRAEVSGTKIISEPLRVRIFGARRKGSALQLS